MDVAGGGGVMKRLDLAHQRHGRNLGYSRADREMQP